MTTATAKTYDRQTATFLAVVGQNMPELSGDVMQEWIENPKALQKALRVLCPPETASAPVEFFRETGELSITIPALKRPTLKDLQAKYDWIKSIERDTSTEEAVTLSLATVLAEGSTSSIGGKEYEKRIALKHDVLLGFQHRQWLLEHQDEFPELKSLLGKVYIDFPGLVVVSRDGDRRVPYCRRLGSRWDDSWDWLDNDFDSDGRVAFGK